MIYSAIRFQVRESPRAFIITFFAALKDFYRDMHTEVAVFILYENNKIAAVIDAILSFNCV